MNTREAIKKKALESLCVYDPRNPDCDATDEEDNRVDGVTCYCDNCFYGRSQLAKTILNLLDAENNK